MEKRSTLECELRANDVNGKPVIVGRPLVYDSWSVPIGEGRSAFKERIAPGAIDASLRSIDLLALIEHDVGRMLGRQSAKTLRVSQDSRGMIVEIDPPDTSAGRDAVASIKRGDMRGMSFGFDTEDDSWEERADGTFRTLRSIKVHEVSIVAMPYYQATEVALRSLGTWRDIQSKEAELSAARVRRLRLLRGQA
jgi:HK97 family phage prohead protease